ncbi:hypothetical protein BGZ91_010737 [Linnemannia elongata]|nr:hypothetical protein BGZ91_010737 [Linnemannia elongata]
MSFGLEPLRIAVVPNAILDVVVTESQSAGEGDDTPVSKFSEAEKVVIKAEPQEPKISIVDDVEDMAVKENPRDDEIVVLKVVKAVQKEKDKDEDVLRAGELMAGERGDAETQFRVGSMYRRGQGIPQSNAKSRKWYLRAAEGHSNAQFKLGMLLENGTLNVAKDLVTAVDWSYKAANHGHPRLSSNLAYCMAKARAYLWATTWR